MEVRKPKEWEREEKFTMLKGGKGYTIADIEALPEGERAELIDGELFRMDAPTWTHQEIQMAISAKIWNFIARHKGSCRVLPAPFAVYIKKDNRNYVEPDISVICDEEKKSEKGCQGAPDWTIEIVSPSSKTMDYERKVKLYREAGVREYWIINPETETVTVYNYAHCAEGVSHSESAADRKQTKSHSEAVCYDFSEPIRVGIFTDLILNLSEMDLR